ncbi:DUF309 domain-containing protein [Paenibacillus sp. chi10]|uniref:DUF309 domain-containing protein n=1 Tax=Paenibacillus suaedae TaxID=3077233 RepID=A0AAJ2JXP5_9BACL|nr:DUF309 domain-containing protein [Paenibacillus sp. chi10]MDT8976193.1 DUF309 domain-containing protein [Paenibacillus sp. chi10]
MRYPKAYIEYLAHFHGPRDWFECHEIMEEYWKEEPSAERKRQWLALVQIAVGLYHERRGNVAGTLKMLSSALGHAEAIDWGALGINGETLKHELKARVALLTDENKMTNAASTYSEWNFPIEDQYLLELCIQSCADKGWTWCMNGSQSIAAVRDKHLLRDRTDVIEARQQAFKARTTNRKSTRSGK